MQTHPDPVSGWFHARAPIAPNAARMKLIDKQDVIGYMRPHKVKIPSNGIEM
jgi:hypothetical protein